MKQQVKIETMAESQNGQGISASDLPLTPPLEGSGFNIFLIQNKGKGPPGRIRSPGAGVCRKPDYVPATINNIKTYQKTDFQYFNKLQFSIFYSHN